MFFSKLFKRNFRFKYDPESVTNYFAQYLYKVNRSSGIKPTRLFIYPTALCNDSCKYCSDGARADEKEVDGPLKFNLNNDFFSNKQYIDRLVNDIKSLKIKDIHIFGGGEPFYYKTNMFYFLNSLKDTDTFIRIITNTKNLNEHDIERIVKNRLVSQLNISLNTESEETAKKLYLDPGRHSATINTLKFITKYKDLCHDEFPKIDIMFTILNINYDKINSIISILKEYKINYFFFQPLRCYSDKQKEFMLSDQQKVVFESLVCDIENRLKKVSIRSNISEFKKDQSLPSSVSALVQPFSPVELLKNKHGLGLKCYMPFTTLSICYNGNIPMCQFRYDKQYVQNYFNIKSLREFIKSVEYLSFINNFINGNFPKICSDCNFCVPSELETINQRFLLFSKNK